MSRNATKDLTTGSPMKLILGFGIPLLFGMLFQQFYNMMDTIIVGKFLGVSALASVGATGSINFMIIGFCMGVCNGFAIPVAQRFGAKDEHGMRKFVANSVWLSIIFAVVMAVLVCVFCRQILELMNTPEDIIDGSYSYIFVIFLGIPATYMYNLLSGIMRSLGDSKTPLYTGFAVYYRSENGRGRCCMGDSDRTGRLRFLLSGCYLEEIPDSACSERGMAAG